MGYFDSEMEEMLEVYLLETKQLTEQLSAVLLEAEKIILLRRKIFAISSGHAHDKRVVGYDGA